MNVDVITQTQIDRPRKEVFAFAADPDNAPRWYLNIKRVERESDSRIRFLARFLGRDLAYTYEIVELVPDEKLVMRTAQGPFPMETTYTFADAGNGATTMTLRNRGTPKGFAAIMAPMMASAMKRANRKDLALLKRILEAPESVVRGL
jgi:uncharacterized protein YndB with AHSA1/START domain